MTMKVVDGGHIVEWRVGEKERGRRRTMVQNGSIKIGSCCRAEIEIRRKQR